jgi:hypothetical protein
MKPVIPPTTGRRVLLFIAAAAAGGPALNNPKRPFDAGVAYVWSDDQPDMNRINVGYTDHNGVAHNCTSVALHDRPQNDNDEHGKEAYAVWMPHQFEQAMRALQPKQAFQAAPPRPGDIELVKLEENGELTDAGREKLGMTPPESLPRAEGLGDDATGEQLRASYEGDGGVLEGTDRTTSGTIGQP